MGFTIKKINVYPKGDIRWDNGVYLGASMNNLLFKDEKTLNEILEFINSNVNHYCILVGDYLHRYNEIIFNGLNESEAITNTIEKGQSFSRFFELEAKKHSAKFEFIFSKDIVKTPGFQDRVNRFFELYFSNLRFKELVDYTIKVFLRRQNEIKISYSKAEELCKEYLVEELAIFEVLAERGLHVNIYPGNQLPITKEIVSGKLKGVSAALENMQAIEIKFRPKF